MANSRIEKVVIIGGGHNGIVAANLLAQVGMDVTLVEKNEKVGGAAFTGEFAPGLKYAQCSYSLGMMKDSLLRRLGVWPRTKFMQGGYFAPRAAGGYLRLPDDRAARDAELLEKCGEPDLKAYNKYQAWIDKLNGLLQPWMNYTRLDDSGHVVYPTSAPPVGITLIEKLRRKSIGQILNEGFRSKIPGFDVDPIQSDQLKGIKAVSASICTKGPFSPESIFSVLNLQGNWGFPEGGMGKLSDDIADKAKEYGATIRTSTPVKQIKVTNDNATGVVLDDGTEIDADIVVTAVDPHISYLMLLDSAGQRAIGESFLKRIRGLRYESGTVKVNLALDGRVLPRDFTEHPQWLPDAFRDTFVIAESMTQVEQAFLDAASGRPAAEPMIDVALLTAAGDTTLVDEDKFPGWDVVSLFCQSVPDKFANSPHVEEIEKFADTVIGRMDAVAPGFRDRVQYEYVDARGPWQIQSRTGLQNGNIYGLPWSWEPRLDTTTPIAGLVDASAATHNGGCVNGIPGRNAADHIIRHYHP